MTSHAWLRLLHKTRRSSQRRGRGSRGSWPQIELLEDRNLPAPLGTLFGPPSPLFDVTSPLNSLTNIDTAVVADFTGEGNLDVAVLSNFDGSVSVLPGDGKGGLGAPIEGSSFQVTGSLAPLVAGDFNGDGNKDLALLTFFPTGQPSIVNLLLGDGQGHFTSPVLPAPITASTSASSLTVGDFNGDGLDDLATGANFLGEVDVLLNTTPSKTAPPSFSVSKPFVQPGISITAISAGKIYGGPVDDLAFGLTGAVAVLKNSGSGTFQFAGITAVPESPQALSIGDFNGDGHGDIVHVGRGKLGALLNDNMGGFLEADINDIEFGNSLAVADFNGDGKDDVVSNDPVGLPEHQFAGFVRVALGADQAPFSVNDYISQPTIPPDVPPGEPTSVVVGDFNGDFAPDIAVVQSGLQDPHANITILLNQSGRPVVSAVTATPFLVTLDNPQNPEIVHLVATISDADPNAVLTYHWSLQAPAGSQAALVDDTGPAPTFTPDVAGNYLAQLVVSDAVGQSSTPMSVTVTASLPPLPVVSALTATPQLVTLDNPQNPEIVHLVVATVSDADPNAVFSYHWSLQAPAGSQAALVDDTGPAPTFTPDMAGSYLAQLVVSDAVGQSSTPMSVTVTASLPPLPVVSAVTATPQVVTLGNPQEIVQLVATVSDADPNAVLTYDWSLQAPAGSQAALSDNGPLAFFTPDVAGSYLAQLVVSDAVGQPSNTVSETIEATATTTTALMSAPNPAFSGQGVTFTATVTSAAAGTPTGLVSFFVDGSPIATATAPLQPNGQAFTTFALPVGAHSIVAIYNGDTLFAASTSNTVSETINARAATTTMITAVIFNKRHQIVGFTVTVTSAAGTPTGGTVRLVTAGKKGSFTAKDAKVLRLRSITVSVGPDGTLIFEIVPTKPVSLLKPIVAEYSGDTQFAGSVSAPLTRRGLP